MGAGKLAPPPGSCREPTPRRAAPPWGQAPVGSLRSPSCACPTAAGGPTPNPRLIGRAPRALACADPARENTGQLRRAPGCAGQRRRPDYPREFQLLGTPTRGARSPAQQGADITATRRDTPAARPRRPPLQGRQPPGLSCPCERGRGLPLPHCSRRSPGTTPPSRHQDHRREVPASSPRSLRANYSYATLPERRSAFEPCRQQ